VSKNAQYVKGVALPGQLAADVIAAFHERTEQRGDHLIWTATVDHETTPVLVRLGYRYPALQVAWVLHHGSRPQGHVRRSCSERLCVAGRCLTDGAMRQKKHHLMAAVLGVDLSGTCTEGHSRREHGVVGLNGKVDCRVCDTRRRRASRAAENEVAAA